MKKLLLLLFLSSLGCSINTSEKVELEKLRFNYTDDAYIFFRNMRQTHYDLEVMEEGGWRIYRHEDRKTDTADFYFNISLVVNWRANRAYPIIEMSDDIEKKGLEIIWEAIESGEAGIVTLDGLKRKDEMLFTAMLYNKMIEEVKMYLIYRDKKILLFPKDDHKEAFRIALYDFYRLTGQL